MNAADYKNDSTLEQVWAVRAFDEAETHYDLITTVDPTFLKLSLHDDWIHEEFRKIFPDLDVNHLIEDELKSEAAKKKWREFCLKFEKVLQNYNYGSLVRVNPLEGYTDANTIFVTRVQYLAVEIARNKEGITKELYDRVTRERREKKEINKLSESAANVSVSS